MKKVIFAMILVMVMLVMSGMVNAAKSADTNVVVDLKDLDNNTRNAVVEAIKQKEKAAASDFVSTLPKMDPSSAKEWVSVFTTAIRDICHDLNVEVNEFIKTPVGMLVGGLIVYKVVGKDVINTIKRITLGTIGWVVTMACLYIFVARKFFIRRKLKYTDTWNDKERGVIKRDGYVFVTPYEFKSSDARTVAACFMTGVAIVITIVAMITVLGA